jgi:hypothetical protein
LKNARKDDKKLLYDFRGLKCTCNDDLPKGQHSNEMSVGESFIQYYYLCQRRIHAEVVMQAEQYRSTEDFGPSESTMMSLSDVIKVKKMADNISFFRLFFLKNQRTYINMRNLAESNVESKENKLDLIDGVLAIYLFELTRITRSGKHLYRKD